MDETRKPSQKLDFVFLLGTVAASCELTLEEIAERLRKVAEKHLPETKRVWVVRDALRIQVNGLLFEIEREYLRKATRYRWADA